MVTKSYGVDLQLPVVPDYDIGPEYAEFTSLYKILNQLQDAISISGGLVSISSSETGDVGLLELFGLNRNGYLIFEAGTDITVGAPCQVYDVGGVAKVRQPPQYYLQPMSGGNASGGFDDGGRGCAEAAGFMPMFNATAGQLVAVAGTGGVALATGAVKGLRYGLNSAMALQGTAGEITHFHADTYGFLIKNYMYMGYCIEDGVLLCFPSYFFRLL